MPTFVRLHLYHITTGTSFKLACYLTLISQFGSSIAPSTVRWRPLDSNPSQLTVTSRHCSGCRAAPGLEVHPGHGGTRGVRQGGPTAPGPAADGHHIPRRPPVAAGHQGPVTRPAQGEDAHQSLLATRVRSHDLLKVRTPTSRCWPPESDHTTYSR